MDPMLRLADSKQWWRLSDSWFSWMVCSLVLIRLQSIEKINREGKGRRRGAEGCFRWSLCATEAKLANKCPVTWDSRPEGRWGWSLLSVVRFSAFGLWAVNSFMKFVFSFYWRNFPHKVPLQAIKTPSESWEPHSIFVLVISFLQWVFFPPLLVAPCQSSPSPSSPSQLLIPRSFVFLDPPCWKCCFLL